MVDINKAMSGEGIEDPEKLDHMSDLEGWTEDFGRARAAEEGIDMTAEHWEIVQFLRDHYREHGRARSGRHLSEALDERFEERGGRKYLYRLFPNGPVVQGSRIAGLPLPEYAKDGSFGYSQ